MKDPPNFVDIKNPFGFFQTNLKADAWQVRRTNGLTGVMNILDIIVAMKIILSRTKLKHRHKYLFVHCTLRKSLQKHTLEKYTLEKNTNVLVELDHSR